MHNHSYTNEFKLHMKEIPFSYERMGAVTKTTLFVTIRRRRFGTYRHRKHTILLNRKRVNKGMKRTNGLPSSPVVTSYATLQHVQRKPLPTSPA